MRFPAHSAGEHPGCWFPMGSTNTTQRANPACRFCQRGAVSFSVEAARGAFATSYTLSHGGACYGTKSVRRSYNSISR